MADQTDMSIRDVESVLAQMQLEVTQKLNEQRTLKYVAGVIATYKKVMAELAGAETKQAALEKAIASLQGTHDARVIGYRKELDAVVETCTREQASANASLSEARKRAADLDAQVKDKEAFAARRSAELDTQIKAKAAQLEKLTGDYNAFRQRHGLASGE